jgi:hypothetical protein
MKIGPITINFGMVSADSAKSSGKSGIPITSALHSERLAHDRAATSQNLKIGHASTAGRDIVRGSRRGERPKGGRRGLHEEGAKGARLVE